jgi:hypothetical protein
MTTSTTPATASTYFQVMADLFKYREVLDLNAEQGKFEVKGFDLSLRRAKLVYANLQALESNGFKSVWATLEGHTDKTKLPTESAHLQAIGLVTESEVKSKWASVLKKAGYLAQNETLLMLFRREVAKGSLTLSLRQFIEFAEPLTEADIDALVEQAESEGEVEPTKAEPKAKAVSTFSFRLADVDPDATRSVAARIDAEGNLVTSNTKAELLKALAVWSALVGEMPDAEPVAEPVAEGFSRVAI